MKLLPCQLFQLTSPRGGWHSADLPNTTHGIFQLTSSQGGWQWCMLLLMKKMYFNSHPHKEDDEVRRLLNILSGIFQLTSSQGGWLLLLRFVTLTAYFNSHPHKEDDSSNSGSSSLCVHFNSHPHKEDDEGDNWWYVSWSYFNSHPHKEDDCTWTAVDYWKCISTHILTRRMTYWNNLTRFYKAFQLTSSQGGWH